MSDAVLMKDGVATAVFVGTPDATTAAAQAATATAQAAIATAQAGAAAGSAATAASKIALARYGIPLGPKGGAIWDLADWKTTLYQDSAATVPVTADGDLVGCIRNVLGDTNWDLIQATSGNRPTFKLLHGVPWIECAAGKGLSARTNKAITLPCLLLAGIRSDADPAAGGAYPNSHFGFDLGSSNQAQFHLCGNTIGQSAARIAAAAPSRALVVAADPPYSHPVKSRMVMHALAKTGSLDCRINDSSSDPAYSPKTTTWDGTESIAGMVFGINIGSASSGVPTFDATKSMGFFGGAVLFDDPGDTIRNKLVAYFQAQLEIKIADQGTASGAIVFSAQPTVNSIITINGTAITYVASGAGANQVNLGGSLSVTLDNTVAVLNASAVAGVARATYSKTGTTTLTITHDAFGPDGNNFTLAAGTSPATNGTVSGATLTGGGDKVILCIGDSTSDDIDTTSAAYMPECFLSWAQTYLGPGDLTKTIYYRNWGQRSDIFTGWQRVQTGTGPDKIFISNISVSGTQPSFHMASRFPRSIASHAHVDEVVWNHGHNMAVTLTDPSGWLRRGEYMDAMDKVRRQFPTATNMAFRVHPLLAAAYIDPVVAAIDGVAAAYGDLALADIYAKFILDGKPAGYYAADGLHLSIAVGMPVQRDVFNTAYNAWQSAKPAVVAASRIGLTATNGLLNGRFQDFDGASPDSWTFTAGTGGTVRRATNIVDTELVDNSSVEIAQTSGDSYIEQQISAVVYRGNPVVLAVRLALPVGAAPDAGRIQLSSNGTGAVSATSWVYQPSGKPTGLFRWAYLHLPPIPADATTITVRLHGCAVGTGKAYFGRAVLVAGSRPKDIR